MQDYLDEFEFDLKKREPKKGMHLSLSKPTHERLWELGYKLNLSKSEIIDEVVAQFYKQYTENPIEISPSQEFSSSIFGRA